MQRFACRWAWRARDVVLPAPIPAQQPTVEVTSNTCTGSTKSPMPRSLERVSSGEGHNDRTPSDRHPRERPKSYPSDTLRIWGLAKNIGGPSVLGRRGLGARTRPLFPLRMSGSTHPCKARAAYELVCQARSRPTRCGRSLARCVCVCVRQVASELDARRVVGGGSREGDARLSWQRERRRRQAAMNAQGAAHTPQRHAKEVATSEGDGRR